MKIKAWHKPEDQMCQLGRNHWSVPRLFQLTKDFPVLDIPLDHINMWHTYDKLTLRELVMHMKAVQAADLHCPIILDEDGEIMDGRHRLMKAMLEGKETIMAVRFDENPSPCRVEEKP